MTNSNIVRVGFLGNVSKEWMGGVNYLKNLLYAISILPNGQIKPIVFVGKNTDAQIKKMFSQYAEVIETSVLERKSIAWFLWRTVKRLFKTDIVLEFILKKYKINVFSHANIIGLYGIKTLSWIPDFQHIHLPQMFSSEEILHRNESFKRIISKSDTVVLSSYDALNDFKKFAPDFVDKAVVLQFVAQPNRGLFENDAKKESDILNKHSIFGKFFYLPNQFWQHKNHKVVFEALAILKSKNINIPVVCSGYMNDYRNINYIEELNDFVCAHQLDVKFLGLIDYDDVVVLMKRSVAVINPSLFEGWSSTVEECKSIGKNMILSDIPVHREQNPPCSIFFDPNCAGLLSEILLSRWLDDEIAQERETQKLIERLENRTVEFGKKYESIILGLVGYKDEK